MTIRLQRAALSLALMFGSLPAAAQINVGSGITTNSGSVTVSSGAAATFDQSGGTLFNQGSLTSTGTGTSAKAVTSPLSVSNLTLNNFGSIAATGPGTSAISMVGSNVTIINNVGATITGFATAIETNSNANITNRGTISSNGTGIGMNSGDTLVNTGTITAGGNGVSVSAFNNTVVPISNSGTIRSLGTAIPNSSALLLNGRADVTNSGTLQGPFGISINSNAQGGLQWTVTNTGTIIGSIAAIQGPVGAGSMALTTSGTIVGNINLGVGADTVTIKGGSISGNIVGRGATGQTVTFDHGSSSLAFVGAIQNVPTVNFLSGEFTAAPGFLTNVSAVTIGSAGSLTLNGDLASNVTNAGRLVIGANRTITGTYNQTGTLAVTVGAIGGNLLTVSGAATLTSPKFDISTPSNRLIRVGDTFQIVTANGGLTVTGTPVATSQNALLLFIPSQSGNTESVTAALDTNSALARLRSAGGASAGVAQAILAIVSSNTTVRSDLSNAIATVLNQSGGQLQNTVTSLAPNTGNTSGATAGTMSSVSGGNSTVSTRLQQTRAPGGDPLTSAGPQYWAQGYGGTLRQGVRNNFAGFVADSYGLMLGGDREVGDKIRLGVAAGIARTEVTADASRLGDYASVNGYAMNVYASYSPGPYYLDGMVMAGINDNGSTRQVDAFGLVAKGSYDSYQTGFRVNAGVPLPVAGFTVTPNVFTQYTFLDREAYSETRAGGLGLRARSQDTHAAELGVGVRIAYPLTVERGTAVPELRLNYIREVGDDRVPLTAAFQGGGPAFTTSGPSIPRDNFNVGAGATFYEIRDLSVSLNYDYLTNDASSGHTGTIRLRAAF